MDQRKLAWLLLGLWAAIYTWSIVATQLIAPASDGFTQGLNRIATFFGWQLLASLVSLFLWWAGRSFVPGSAGHWVSRIPLGLAMLLLIACGGLIVWGNLSKPSPEGYQPNPLPNATTVPIVKEPVE
mgnify:CR=1 FL=1|tara:strand:+ start:239 stop:619 length:381 start_codon:yes stop_codon:yes gene_type:complete